jgi:N6-adenosine-specific RNA methylase IME4
MGDLAGLAKSIDDRGALLQPVVITADNKLIAGQRRIAAWALSKFRREPIPVNIVDIDAIVMGERDENAQRKDFTPTEAVAIKREIEEFLKARADARPTAMRSAPGREAQDGGRAADKAAGYVGKGRRTIEKTEKLMEAAERDPARYGALLKDAERTGRVDGPFKRLENMLAGERLKAEPPPPPMQGPYRTLVIDFPWPADLDGYRDQADRGYYPYATMSMEQIVEYAAAQVAPILHDEGAAVWLWIPNFHLVRGCHTTVLKALGVEGSTMLTWVKPEIGQGQRLRGATEHAILAVKGKVPVLGHEQRTWFEAPGGKAHSAKPETFFHIVETVTPAPRYAFLFAGGSVPENWDGHGDRIGQRSDGEVADASIDGIPLASIDVIETFTELQALEAIEAGREIDIKLPIVVFLKEQKLARGSVKLKLTKAGMVRLEALRKEEYVKADEAEKALNDYERLIAAGEKAGHVLTLETGGKDDITGDALRSFNCSCEWRTVAFDTAEGAASSRVSIEAHLRAVCVESVALRTEAAEKTAERGSKRAKRPPKEKPAQIDIEDLIVGVDCRVCSDGSGLCAECIAAGDHIVAMTNLDGDSIATCSCGWVSSVPWGGHYEIQDAAVKAHWQNVVTEANAAAASGAEPDIPENLRLGPDGLAPYQRSEAAE